MRKFYINNIFQGEMEEFGFKEIVHKGTVSVKFARMNNVSESRLAFIYTNKSMFKTRKDKWKIEHEHPTKDFSSPFKAMWNVHNEGRIDPNTDKVKIKISVNNAILSMNMELKFCDQKLGRRKSCGPKYEYNLKDLDVKAWCDCESVLILSYIQ